MRRREARNVEHGRRAGGRRHDGFERGDVILRIGFLAQGAAIVLAHGGGFAARGAGGIVGAQAPGDGKPGHGARQPQRDGQQQARCLTWRRRSLRHQAINMQCGKDAGDRAGAGGKRQDEKQRRAPQGSDHGKQRMTRDRSPLPRSFALVPGHHVTPLLACAGPRVQAASRLCRSPGTSSRW